MSIVFSKAYILPVLVVFLHVVGLLGTIWPATKVLTLTLTPVNLLLSFVILAFSHEPKGKALWWLIVATAAIGFFVEVVGVQTGLVFGNYRYGPTLGLKAFNVPLMIGINWFLLSYIFSDIAGRFLGKKWSRVLIAAFLMVLIDILIEPIAIKYDYWEWASGEIPLQNYVSWFIIGALIQLMFVNTPHNKNPLSLPILTGQLIYFGGLHLYLLFF